MNRTPYTILFALAATFVSATAWSAEPAQNPAAEFKAGECGAAFGDILAQSRSTKRGVKLYVKGEEVAGIVLDCPRNGTVELKSQEYGRIVVRTDSIDAAAMP